MGSARKWLLFDPAQVRTRRRNNHFVLPDATKTDNRFRHKHTTTATALVALTCNSMGSRSFFARFCAASLALTQTRGRCTLIQGYPVRV